MIVIDLSIVRINLNSLRITLVMCGWLFIFWLSRLLVVVCRIFFFFFFFSFGILDLVPSPEIKPGLPPACIGSAEP